ncbi:MAG: superoxide dismutase [Alphaproteobacteria bacterium]|jgi:Fe-Mn family superoxide dismutase|nr:superoxide dismutase [Alphaproteobacteria bacterium]
MSFELNKLNYAIDGLAPFMSQETLEYHYGKHHQTYITNLNKLLENSDLKEKSLIEIIKASHNVDAAIFNNAAQHYNHIEFWNSMMPNGGKITPTIEKVLTESFGSVEKFKEQIINAGLGVFGSGWVWLAKDGNKLEIIKCPNAENPLVHGKTPILGCDVWEHSYYIDYRNKRADFLKAWFENLINWEYVETKLQ